MSSTSIKFYNKMTRLLVLLLLIASPIAQGLASTVTTDKPTGTLEESRQSNLDKEEDQSNKDVYVIYGSYPQPEPASASDSVSSSFPTIQTFTVGPNADTNDQTMTTDTSIADTSTSASPLEWSKKLVPTGKTNLVTKTVTGFLDFVTTIGDTVLIFTPQVTSAKSQQFGPSASPSQQVEFGFDEGASIGIEQLFRDFERPEEQPNIETEPLIESSFGNNDIGLIKPTNVVRTQQLEDVQPAEPISRIGLAQAKKSSKESVQIVEPTSVQSNPPSIRVQSSTILSNFIDGVQSVGLVTSTGNTLIANGVTTVNAIRVFGTYLSGGQYAQVVQSSAEIFEEDILPTAGFSGTVQYVSEKPSFGVEVAGINQQKPRKRENLSGIFNKEEVEEEENDKAPSTGSRLQQTSSQKESATNDLRNRLKNRFQKFKARVNSEDEARGEIVGHGSVSPIDPATLRSGKAPSFAARPKTARLNKDDVAEEISRDNDTNDEDLPETDRSGSQRALSSFGQNRRNFREPPKRLNRNRINPATESTLRRNTPDLSGQASIQHEVSSDIGTKKRNNFRDRNAGLTRFRGAAAQKAATTAATANAIEAVKEPAVTSTNSIRLPSPDTVRGIHSIKTNRLNVDNHSSDDKPVVKPNVVFKSFNRFSRPDTRKSLLEKILNKGKGEHTLDPEQVKQDKLEKDLDEEKTTQSFIDSNDVSELNDDLQTTLHVSTVFPPATSSVFLEVATIRSPYSFDFEDGKSTRFITVTRTFTSSVAEPSTAIAPSIVASKMPLFKTETIPPPENILTSTASLFDDHTLLDISSSIETLPAVLLLESSTAIGTPPLKTVTETFSTRELTLKTSVLPIVVNGKTSLHTLTQSFYVTKLVEAVKTVPAGENYEFIATQAFKDFNNVLEEAGSEKREQLLPGELEFSDQDNYDLNGPNEVRVPPPEGFEDDLKILGTKFDSDDKKEEAAIAIQSSIEPITASASPAVEQAASSPTSTTTPTLPQFNPLASFTPEQIQQLAFLQYLQNFGGFNGFPNMGSSPFNQGQEVITSSPVYRTETLFATSTIPLFLGAKKFFTTLTQSIGVTTVTDYDVVTVSPSQQDNPFGGMFPQQGLNPIAAASQAPAFIETSHEVIKDTVIPSTIYKEIKITFRNSPTTTTLTSVTMVSTQITSYVTKTVRAQATQNPFNPFAAFG